MKRLLTTLPLLAAIAVVGYSAVQQPDRPGFTTTATDARELLPVQMLPPGHPPVEQWVPVLPEGHPPLVQRNPHLPEGHPPIPGYAGECPRFRGRAGGNTDEPTADAQELIST